jgi:hypothetical protein
MSINIFASSGWDNRVQVYDVEQDNEHLGDVVMPSRPNRLAGLLHSGCGFSLLFSSIVDLICSLTSLSEAQ